MVNGIFPGSPCHLRYAGAVPVHSLPASLCHTLSSVFFHLFFVTLYCSLSLPHVPQHSLHYVCSLSLPHVLQHSLHYVCAAFFPGCFLTFTSPLSYPHSLSSPPHISARLSGPTATISGCNSPRKSKAVQCSKKVGRDLFIMCYVRIQIRISRCKFSFYNVGTHLFCGVLR